MRSWPDTTTAWACQLYADLIGAEVSLAAVYDLARRITAKYGAAGYVLSFSGTVTFRNAEPLRDAAMVVPLQQLLVETDAQQDHGPDDAVAASSAAGDRPLTLLVESRGADFLPLYRTVELRPPAPEGDVALLASASAARAFAATGARMPVVVIGPQTEAEARARGLEVVAVAASHDLDGLLDAVASL